MIRDAAPRDFPAILALNAESVHFLSPLDEARLRRLHTQAARHRVVEVDGSHVIMISQPRAVADAILDAVKTVG